MFLSYLQDLQPTYRDLYTIFLPILSKYQLEPDGPVFLNTCFNWMMGTPNLYE